MSNTPPFGPKFQPRDLPPQYSSLDVMMKSRPGGPRALQGFVYQVRCAALEILRKLLLEEGTEDPSPQDVSIIQLEGIEDLDHCRVSIGPQGGSSRESIQVKHSINDWDASALWDKVLKGFVGPYLSDPTTTFRLMHNMDFLPGHASELVEASQTGQSLDADALTYWTEKFDRYRASTEGFTALGALERAWDWTDFSLEEFLNRVTFEQISEDDLDAQVRQEFIDKLGLQSGQERPYINTLLWSTLDWSRERREVTIQDIRGLVQEVAEDIRRGLDRLVVEGGRLVPVSFERGLKAGDEDRYFEGWAGRPEHIAAELPVRRLDWERQILEIFDENDVTVIRAPSGHGKSTLAWQVVKELSERGFQPYELLKCETSERTDNLVAFLKSRVKVGELPLVVLDGLRSNLKAWKDLAECTRDLPVKYVVTTREEDWRRFGGDPLGLRLREISLKMTQDEAQAIYETLGEKEKLHESAPVWQVAWEQVEGLLIEYVALVTGGEMLKARIERQLNTLEDEPSSSICLEILCLVSAADICGLSLVKSSLMNHVMTKFRTRSRVLSRLNGEFLRSEKEDPLVQGLHPVRSRHLSQILSSDFLLIDTLIDLIPLIQPGDFFNFCTQAPLLLSEVDREQFLSALAEYLAQRSYPEMLAAVEGIFVTDILSNWEERRKLFDDIIADSESISNAYKRVYQGFNSDDWADRIGGLPSLEIFLTSLQQSLDGQSPSRNGLAALGPLELWFSSMNLSSPIVSHLDPESIWSLVESHGLKDLDGLFYFLANVFPEKYRAIRSAYGSEFFDRLCDIYEIIQIQPTENRHLEVEHFASTSREDYRQRFAEIYRFLPVFSKYAFKISNFSSGDPYRILSMDQAEMRFRDELLNRRIILWLMQVNPSPSPYEWQRQWFQLRQYLLAYSKAACAYWDALLRRDGSERKRQLGIFEELLPKIKSAIGDLSELRVGHNPDFDRPFLKYHTILMQWVSEWMLFLDIVSGQSSKTNPYIPLRRLIKTHLPRFQMAYREILNQTSDHFDSSGLEEEEREWYSRFYQITYYFTRFSSILRQLKLEISVLNPTELAERFFEEAQRKNLDDVRKALDRVESRLGVTIFLADQILEEPSSSEDEYPQRAVAFAVSFVNLDDLFQSLVPALRDVQGVDLFYLYTIRASGHLNGVYYPLSKDYIPNLHEQLYRQSLGMSSEPQKPPSSPVLPHMLGLFPGLELRRSSLDGPHFDLFNQVVDSVIKLSQVRLALNANPNSSRLLSLEVQFKSEAAARIHALETSDLDNSLLTNDFVQRLRAVLEYGESTPGSFLSSFVQDLLFH